MNAARILFTALLLAPIAAHAQTAETTPPAEPQGPGSKRPGFILAVEFGGAAYNLDDQISDALSDQGAELSSEGGGMGLVFGYSWRNEFQLELSLFGADLGTGQNDVEAGMAQFELGARVPLLPRHRVSPWLGAQLGGTVLALGGAPIEDKAVYGGSTGLGAGVEVHLGRRWALDFGYHFSLVNFQEATVEVAGGGDQEIDLDGNGRVHRWAVRTTFSF